MATALIQTANAITTQYTIVYEGKDITEDIRRFLISMEYTDSVEDRSSKLEIILDNTDGIWSGDWYPQKKARIKATIEKTDCGSFTIDTIKCSGNRNTGHRMTITGLENRQEAPQTLRTKKSRAHENKSLRQIAEAVAKANGLTLTGTVPAINIERVSQRHETDLKFLRRISYDYGAIFTVRDNKLVYTSLYDIDQQQAAFSIGANELIDYDIEDKCFGIYKYVKVSYHNPDSGELIEHTATAAEVQPVRNNDGQSYTTISTEDTLVIHQKVENKQQAEAMAKSYLYRTNAKQQSGTLDMVGSELVRAGVNFELTGLGVGVSGIFNISEAVHKISRGSDWVVSCTIRRVAVLSKVKQQGNRPRAITNDSLRVQQNRNRDGQTFTTIGE